MNKHWILTVPHAVCSTVATYPHPCDTAALIAADEMKKCFERRKLTTAEVIVPEHNRYDTTFGDPNRLYGRDSPMRQRLSNRVNMKLQEKDTTVWVVDVHSFGDYDKWGAEIVVLATQPITQMEINLCQRITSKKGNIIPSPYPYPLCSTQAGSDLNDIVVSMKKANVPAVLIEFFEDSNINQTEHNARVVARALSYIRHKVEKSVFHQ